MTHDSFFRREAVRHAAGQQFGTAVITQPMGLRIGVIAFALMLAAAVVFCAFAKFRESEFARGVLTPISGTVRVYASSDAGVYREILVKEGDVVEQGQVLARIAPSERDEQGFIVEETLLSVMNGSMSDVLKAIELEKQKFHVTRAALSKKIEGIRSQRALMREEHDSLQDRADLALANYRRRQQLVEQRLISADELNDKSATYLAAAQQVSSSSVRMEELSNHLLEQEAALHALPIEHGQHLVELNSRLAQLQISIAQQQQKIRSTIVAPIAGRASAISAVAGDSVSARAPLLTIVPLDRPLEVEVYVPARAAGHLAKGQTIRITYDAFPFQIYGTYEATIRTISDTVVDPREFTLITALTEPVYVVRADLKDQSIAMRQGPSKTLQVGMSLSADVVTTEQTILRWIFSPLLELASNL